MEAAENPYQESADTHEPILESKYKEMTILLMTTIYKNCYSYVLMSIAYCKAMPFSWNKRPSFNRDFHSLAKRFTSVTWKWTTVPVVSKSQSYWSHCYQKQSATIYNKKMNLAIRLYQLQQIGHKYDHNKNNIQPFMGVTLSI